MERDQEPVRIKLTPAQRELVRKVTGKDAVALELTPEEMEERLAPSTLVRPSKEKPG